MATKWVRRKAGRALSATSHLIDRGAGNFQRSSDSETHISDCTSCASRTATTTSTRLLTFILCMRLVI